MDSPRIRAASCAGSGHGPGEAERSREWRLEREVEIRPGQVLLVELSKETGLTAR